MNQQIDFYSVQEWREAGMPLDKSFAIIRRSGLFEIDTPAEIIQARAVEMTEMSCNLILRQVKLCKKDTGATSFSLVPLSAPFCFRHNWFGLLFSVVLVYNEDDIEIDFSEPIKRRQGGWSFEAGAIITLHSKEQNE